MFKRFLSFILALSIILMSFSNVAFASNKDAASTNDNIDAPGTAVIPYTAFEILESILLSFGITYTTVDLLNKSSDVDKFNNALNEDVNSFGSITDIYNKLRSNYDDNVIKFPNNNPHGNNLPPKFDELLSAAITAKGIKLCNSAYECMRKAINTVFNRSVNKVDNLIKSGDLFYYYEFFSLPEYVQNKISEYAKKGLNFFIVMRNSSLGDMQHYDVIMSNLIIGNQYSDTLSFKKYDDLFRFNINNAVTFCYHPLTSEAYPSNISKVCSRAFFSSYEPFQQTPYSTSNFGTYSSKYYESESYRHSFATNAILLEKNTSYNTLDNVWNDVVNNMDKVDLSSNFKVTPNLNPESDELIASNPDILNDPNYNQNIELVPSEKFQRLFNDINNNPDKAPETINSFRSDVYKESATSPDSPSNPSNPNIHDDDFYELNFDLSTVFPFCIPFDIYALFDKLSVDQPVAPVLKIPTYTLNSSFELKETSPLVFNFAVFDSVMPAFRLLILIFFSVCLAIGTTNLIRH